MQDWKNYPHPIKQKETCPFRKNQVHGNQSLVSFVSYDFIMSRGRHGRDLVVVGFTATSAISAYHH